MKLINVPIAKLKAAKYNPAIRVTKAALKGLIESIRINGVLTPIQIDDKFNVIDGHRRSASVKFLGKSHIPAIMTDTKGQKDKYYEQINSTSRNISAKEAIYIYINGGTVSPAVEKKILKLETVVGRTYLTTLGNKYVSISILSFAEGAARHVGDPSQEFLRKLIVWMVKHKQAYTLRKAIEEGISASALKTALKENRPLKVNFK